MFWQRFYGRCVERVVKPVAQIAVGEEVEPKHGGQVGERPPGLRQVVKPLEHEQGEQGCPNLDAQRVVAGADEALDLQVLFERFEEEFDLPTLFVDVGDGRSAEVEVVGEQYDFPFVVRVSHDDAPQLMRTLVLRLGTG